MDRERDPLERSRATVILGHVNGAENLSDSRVPGDGHEPSWSSTAVIVMSCGFRGAAAPITVTCLPSRAAGSSPANTSVLVMLLSSVATLA